MHGHLFVVTYNKIAICASKQVEPRAACVWCNNHFNVTEKVSQQLSGKEKKNNNNIKT